MTPAAHGIAEIATLCKHLKLPTVGREAQRLAEEARRQGITHLKFMAQLLMAELREREERRAARRIKEAGFPRIKTLEGFDFAKAPHLPEARIRELSTGTYIARAEPILFLGEPGTGKTHLATALGVAAAKDGRSVRFTTTGRLVTELVEAKDAHQLGRIAGRLARVDVLILDEFGYLPFSRNDAELLFQILSERQEQKPLILTTNLPFGEWTSIFSDPRLCRAVVDRITHKAHIIETGGKSIRLEEAMARTKRSGPSVSKGPATKKEKESDRS
jgi:DNA replication protein DnaC